MLPKLFLRRFTILKPINRKFDQLIFKFYKIIGQAIKVIAVYY